MDYHFTNQEFMQSEIQKGHFIEYATVHGYTYGTSFSSVDEVINKNRVCILDIDVQGVQNVMKKVTNATYVLILPPSIEELSKRLCLRNTDSRETIQLRLKNSEAEIRTALTLPFTSIIVNNDLNTAYQELKQSIQHLLS